MGLITLSDSDLELTDDAWRCTEGHTVIEVAKTLKVIEETLWELAPIAKAMLPPGPGSL